MEQVPAGYFSKTHGIKGHLVMRTSVMFDASRLQVVFVADGAGKAPYFVEEARETQDAVVLLLEEIRTAEAAKKLIGKEVFIDAGLVEDEDPEEDYTGYTLIDTELGELGTVAGTSDNGHQILVSITYKGKEIILPLAGDFVLSIDEEKKIIRYQAPDGLIDIYLDA